MNEIAEQIQIALENLDRTRTSAEWANLHENCLPALKTDQFLTIVVESEKERMRAEKAAKEAAEEQAKLEAERQALEIRCQKIEARDTMKALRKLPDRERQLQTVEFLKDRYNPFLIEAIRQEPNFNESECLRAYEEEKEKVKAFLHEYMLLCNHHSLQWDYFWDDLWIVTGKADGLQERDLLYAGNGQWRLQ